MTENFSRNVNWVACEKAMKDLRIGRRHWVAKHVSGHCGVGTCMLKWKKQENDACPRCGEQEDARHVWTCQSPEACLLRSQDLFKLRKWLKEQDTAPEISRVLMTRLTSWSFNTRAYPQRVRDMDIRRALQEQDDIGWTNLLEGCVSQHWAVAPTNYYKWMGSRKSGRRWTIALIKKLWDVVWDLWDQQNLVLQRRTKTRPSCRYTNLYISNHNSDGKNVINNHKTTLIC